MKAKFWKSLSLFGTLSFLIVVVSAHASGVSTTNVTHCGTLSGSEIWRAGDNVHIVSCDVTIPEGETLTVEAGTIIKLTRYADIIVHGKLLVQGNSGNPIYLTSYHDDSIGGDTDNENVTPLPEDWGRIKFADDSDDSSIISYAMMRYGGYNDSGVIYLYDASPQISHVTFSHNNINGVELAGTSWSSDRWDNTTIVYVIQSDLTIPAGRTLTIDPGVKIKLGRYDDLLVHGRLDATGTQTEPLHFTSLYSIS